MHEQPSLLFKIFLLFLKIFRCPYRWAKKKRPAFFKKRLEAEINLDTSRMLRRFNVWHRLFFRKNLGKIRFSDAELQHLTAALKTGPVVFLMRNWGQVEYNYFNDLFLEKKLPLVVHNNMVKMGHWMPGYELRLILLKKIDRFFETGKWPFNDQLFNLTESLKAFKPILFCLNLPPGIHWIEASHEAQKEIFETLLNAQKSTSIPLQLVPLHFIYDKHPGRAQKSLTDILLGEKENPGYWRKIFLFLRNFKKRAVAKIGEPLDLNILAKEYSGVAPELLPFELARRLQTTFDLEAKQVTGPKLKSRHGIMVQILNNPKMRQKIRAAGDQMGLDFEAAEKRVARYLKEIASDIHFTLIELWNFFLNWLFNTLYDGLVVDEDGINRIKKVAKNSPLVLVPSHKSHVDYLLLSYVFYQYDLSLPHVCAGVNLNFWPVGPIFRRSGSYFIRRTFPPDPLYPLALRGYVNELMREGYFQEFFIEGTRSRSGKLFPPRTGLLTMMVESFLEGGLEDVYFVPISIVYERIVEERSYLQEMKGTKKKKEKWTDLFRLPKFLWRKYGKVYVQLAEPVSLKAALGNLKKVEKEFVQGFAHQISLAINEVTTLLPSPLVAGALLAHPEKSISFDQIQEKFDSLFHLAQSTQVPLAEGLCQNPQYSVEEILELFIKEGLVRRHEDIEGDFYTIPEESRLHLDFFKNKGMHVFAEAALQKLCSSRAGPHPRPSPSGRGKNSENVETKSPSPSGRGVRGEGPLLAATQKLLSREFFFPPGHYQPSNEVLPDWLPNLILPVLESYRLTLEVIERIPFEKLEEKNLIIKVMTMGETHQWRGKLKFTESLSRFNIQNAIQKYVEMGILKNYRAEMGSAGRHYFSPGTDAAKRAEAREVLNILLKR